MSDTTEPGIQAANELRRERALGLFTFLRQLTELRTKPVRTLDQYEKVVWLSEIPQVPGCHCAAWESARAGQHEVWVEVRKPRLSSPPSPPKDLEPWLKPGETENSDRELPELNERIPIEAPGQSADDGTPTQTQVTHLLAEHPETTERWEQYLLDQWMPWAEQDRTLRRVQRLYTDLYGIYQQQQALGEAYEVVLGLGLLEWRLASGEVVRRHLVTAQAMLAFDPIGAKVTVGPAAEGAKPELEQDMLPVDKQLPTTELQSVLAQLEEMGDAIWAGDSVHDVLRSCINSIVGSQGWYNSSISSEATTTTQPQVTFAPAIIMRRRTERSLLRMFQEICRQLDQPGARVPEGIAAVVDDPDTEVPSDPTPTGEGGSVVDSEIYFPLPANDEQMEIARQVARKRGVLVQGPPGTGKSHTIANLVSHLLALGRRVLVTSHTARALIVLREKLPKPVAPLCVVALGDDIVSRHAMESSVAGITQRHQTWNPRLNEQEIARWRQALDRARQEEAKALKDLRAIREAEVYQHPVRFGSYQGTLQQIAQRLRAEEVSYRWVGPVSEDQEPPLTDAEAADLLVLLRRFSTEEEEELELTIPGDLRISEAVEFAAMVEAEAAGRAEYERVAEARERPEYGPLLVSGDEPRIDLVARLQELLDEIDLLAADPQAWVRGAAVQVLEGRHDGLRALAELTEEHLTATRDRVKETSSAVITGVDVSDHSVAKVDAKRLLCHLESGGKLRGPLFLRPGVVKDCWYLCTTVRVDGRVCDVAEPLRRLIDWIEVDEHLAALARAWEAHTTVTGGTAAVRVAEYEGVLKSLNRCLALRQSVDAADAARSRVVGMPPVPWHHRKSVAQVMDTARAVEVALAWQRVCEQMVELEAPVRAAALAALVHPAVGELAEAIAARDVPAYARQVARLAKVLAAKAELARRDMLFARLGAEAPALATQLCSTSAEEVWQARLGRFTQAWSWSCADGWIRRLIDPAEQPRLTTARARHRERAQECLAELAAAKAWRACLTRLSDAESKYLRAWKTAIGKIGRGTSPRANQYRRDARKNMEYCRSAIPAWIMPIYRVAETIDPKPDMFDVVIIDEASQSGPEALFLQYIARTIVVVGDEKQVSPESVGIDLSAVDELRRRWISGLPFKEALGPGTSFFEYADIHYPGRIALREHFRCMPEIIQFSNSRYYQTSPLIPLKQYGAGRLRPTVATRYVPEGYQQGSSPRVTNPPEAETLVEEVIRCCNDPAYAGKTMGVISLLGEQQARLIQERLANRLGAEEMERRRLRCGDAYAFQGDERDVMFLSMVSAPGDHRIGALTRRSAAQRFNVAATRAREQMWLFHSVSSSDLHSECQRRYLLDYCLHPAVQQSEVAGLPVNELRRLAEDAPRERGGQPWPFDSWFEVDVCLDLLARGYRVLPQEKVAEYRIDLVVEGMRGRLAVECDGDFWHGPERWLEDEGRQSTLGRSGYRFWRVLGSVYYRDPHAALASLWDTLERMDIHPHSEEVPATATTQHDPSESSPVDSVDSLCEGGTATVQSEAESESLASVPEPISASGEAEEGAADQGMFAELPPVPRRMVLPLTEPDTVEPYRQWGPRKVPDPRATSGQAIRSGLVEVIGVEGPMTAERAIAVYAAAAGIQRLRQSTERLLGKALRQAVRKGEIDEQKEAGPDGRNYRVVRLPGTPLVVLRQPGPRALEEVPPSEIATLMQLLIRRSPDLAHGSTDTLFREVLQHYGRRNMTEGARALLAFVWEGLG